jgi:hypothetical protein
MDSLIYPEDGIVDLTLQKPIESSAFLIYSWTITCNGYSAEVADESMPTYGEVTALFNQAYPTNSEAPTEQRSVKKKGPSMHSTRKVFEKPKYIR